MKSWKGAVALSGRYTRWRRQGDGHFFRIVSENGRNYRQRLASSGQVGQLQKSYGTIAVLFRVNRQTSCTNWPTRPRNGCRLN
ncbi:hypothetical protein [Paraburkholderia bannensis]|uniref:hypothetical protein n=1 Tax=Paraburkholderia bannensis TaxID=765414 RepID=UPI002AB6027C|nr:hypothetical protein [Paraburkholderia bannensis]